MAEDGLGLLESVAAIESGTTGDQAIPRAIKVGSLGGSPGSHDALTCVKRGVGFIAAVLVLFLRYSGAFGLLTNGSDLK